MNIHRMLSGTKAALLAAVVIAPFGRVLAEEGSHPLVMPNGISVIAEEVTGDTSPTVCYNPPYIEIPPPPPKKRKTTKCCSQVVLVQRPKSSVGIIPCPSTNTSGNSFIDNINYSYHHFGYDYFMESSNGGSCVPCGGKGSSADVDLQDLPTLDITRIHRPRDVVYPSAFGPGVFQTYDVSLQLYTTANGERYIDLFDPLKGIATRLFDGPWSNNEFGYADPADGIYKDLIANQFSQLRLFDQNGAVTMVHAAAKSAVAESYDREKWTFQIIDLGGGSYAGRVTKIEDERGYGITITYQYQPTDDLQGSQSRLWQMASATDGYGNVVQYHYAAQQVAGRWVVDRIDLPTGNSVNYLYANGALSGVTHPDGTASSFAYSYNTRSKCTVINIDDASADTTHRRKSVYVSTNFKVIQSNEGVFMPQSAQLVRMVVDGADQVSYLNIPHPWATANYVYEGGGAFKYMAFDLWSDLVLYARYAKTWNISRGSATTPWIWDNVSVGLEAGFHTTGFSKTDNFVGCYRNQALWSRDDSNLTTTYSGYSGASRFTKQTYPDGTSETSVFDSGNRETRRIDRLNRVSEYTFDAVGNLLTSSVGSRWDGTQVVVTADTATESWEYIPAGQPNQYRLSAHIDANGNRTDYSYDTRGRLITVTAPADVVGGVRPVTSYQYDTASRLTKVIQPIATNWVAYGYDTRSRVTSVTYGDGSTETSTYGTGIHANLIVRLKDRNGNVTVRDYDLNGRMIVESMTGPALADGSLPPPLRTRSFTYLPGTSTVATVTDSGETTATTFDYRNRPIASTRFPRSGQPLLNRNPVDSLNRSLGSIDAYNRASWLVYDTNNRVIRTVRELVAGALAPSVPADDAARKTYLLGLARVATANPGYLIEDTAYDAAGQVVSRTDAGGTQTTIAYTYRGQPAIQTDAVGTPVVATTSFQYDLVGNRLVVVGPRARTEMTYTRRNLLATLTEAAGSADAAQVRSLTYTLTGKMATDTDALNRTTSYLYGACCDRLVTVTDPVGFQTRFTYDYVGNRTSVTDGNGLVTTTTFDPLNRTLTQTNAAAESTVMVYDENLTDGIGIDVVPAVQAVLSSLGLGAGADGSGVAVTNPRGETSYELRDGLGRTVARIDALGHASRIAYDTVVNGLVATSQTDALGHAVTARADAAGRVRVQIDALGNASQAGFDADGNQVSQSDAGGLGWTAIFDARNRMSSRTTTRTDAIERTQWTYDVDGNRLSETDALGKTENYQYDLRNRRTLVSDRLGGITRFAYDLVGNLVQISDAENETRGGLAYLTGSTQYAYDARNLLIAEAFPTGQQGRTLRTYAYDAGRRLAARNVGILNGAFSAVPAFAGAPEATAYSYDAANRLIMRGYADTRNDTFAYDTAGRLIAAASARYAASVARSYDAAGRLTSEALTLPDGGVVNGVLVPATYAVGYQYDAANRQIGITYPSGTTVVRSYTDRNELAGVTAGGQSVATRVYDTSGRLISTALGNGVVESRSYVPGSPLVASIAAQKTGAPVTGFGYSYDATGRKLGETNSVDVFAAQQFGYDYAGRLNAWVQGLTASPSATQTWNLSLVGDWTSTNRSGVVENRTHTQVHEATQVGGAALAYDTKGNLTVDDKGTALAWDPENRLIAARVTPDVSQSGFGAVASYRYDALGRRIAKTVQGRTTLYLPAGAQTVVEVERTALPSSQTQIDGIEADGTLSNLAQTPASGGILPGAVTRINFQSATAAIPAGFLADKGKLYSTRTNGLSYGWASEAGAWGVERHGAVPLPEFDTFIQALPDGGATNAWSIALPNGSYPVILVAGDALSTEQTNNLQIGDQSVIDTTPSTAPSYEQGNFDGYAVQVTVTSGVLTLAPSAGALRSKLCFVEIGQAGGTISQDTRDRLVAFIAKVNAQTGASPEPQLVQKEFFYGSYVDNVAAFTVSQGATASRYYVSSNHLYSPVAITDSSGLVVERMKYDAYGRQAILPPGGTPPRSHSAVGFDRSFTGYIKDEETGLLHARARQYSPSLGRFVGRDPMKYVDGRNMYCAYYIPAGLDPSGCAWTTLDWVWRYFYGDGSAVDLQETGLFSDWRNGIYGSMTAKFQKDLESHVPTSCGTGSFTRGVKAEVYFQPRSPYIDVNPKFDPLFSLGGSLLRATAECTYVNECEDCECPPPVEALKKSTVTCKLRVVLNDRFTNPHDMNGTNYSDKLYKAGLSACLAKCGDGPDSAPCVERCYREWPDPDSEGTPYGIYAIWNDSMTFTKEYPGCPSVSR